MKCCVGVFSVIWGCGFGMVVWWFLVFWLDFGCALVAVLGVWICFRLVVADFELCLLTV